jgi:hypothetical protein
MKFEKRGILDIIIILIICLIAFEVGAPAC